MKLPLTANQLIQEAALFAALESQHQEPLLYGITDGKAVGTYLERKFQTYLQERCEEPCGKTAGHQKRVRSRLPPLPLPQTETMFPSRLCVLG